MVLDRLGTEEQDGGDLAVGEAAGHQQRHSGLLRGQRLGGQRPAGPGGGPGGGQLIGGALGLGGEVHGREGVPGRAAPCTPRPG
jgi:hypothetical protein